MMPSPAAARTAYIGTRPQPQPLMLEEFNQVMSMLADIDLKTLGIVSTTHRVENMPDLQYIIHTEKLGNQRRDLRPRKGNNAYTREAKKAGRCTAQEEDAC